VLPFRAVVVAGNARQGQGAAWPSLSWLASPAYEWPVPPSQIAPSTRSAGSGLPGHRRASGSVVSALQSLQSLRSLPDRPPRLPARSTASPPCHLRFPLAGLLAPLPTFDTPQPHGPFPSRSTSIGSLRSLALCAFVLLSLLVQSFIDFPACVYSYSDRHRPRTDGTNYTIIPARLRCCVAVCASCPVPAPVLVPFVDNPPNREIAVATAVRLELQPPASIVCSHHQDICRRTQPSRKDCSRPSERAPTALACLRRAGSRPFIPAPDRIANPSPSLLPPTPTYPADSPTGTTSHHDGSPSPRIASPPALVAMSTTN
jgi:hypothetical protein